MSSPNCSRTQRASVWRTEPRLLFSGAALSLAIIGCSPSSPPADSRDPAADTIRDSQTDPSTSEPTFAQQIADVQASQTTRIDVITKITASDLPQLSNLDSLTDLLIDGGVVTDKGLAAIATCPNLKHLRLRFSPISDAGMQQIAQMAELEILNLPQSQVTAAGIAELKQLSKLRQLRLGSTHATAAICQPISELTGLRSLHLIDIPVDDENLLRLADLKSLRSLYIDGGRVTDAGWQAMFEKRRDLHIHIDQTHHDLDPGKHDPDH
ncbi:Leucine Rich repeats (2 copies) [Rosistilla ulvae]|uniref:Leucine Rich repeats (2 copies) n=1 Tax=Rosistilla ulvae TaxID=1930277 RepID=A0A517LWH4_9BACT|nr:hypothetical protein [Rosistilla ulvae]QDS86970.1 Leucine Rich repeats (2 copies) [Rosistilla ulvae]